MSKFEEVHYIAERFLEDYHQAQANTLTTERLELSAKQVMLVRSRIPAYFVDFKANGRKPIWSHDIRFAKTIPISEFDVWAESLKQHGEEVKMREVIT